MNEEIGFDQAVEAINKMAETLIMFGNSVSSAAIAALEFGNEKAKILHRLKMLHDMTLGGAIFRKIHLQNEMKGRDRTKHKPIRGKR